MMLERLVTLDEETGSIIQDAIKEALLQIHDEISDGLPLSCERQIVSVNRLEPPDCVSGAFRSLICGVIVLQVGEQSRIAIPLTNVRSVEWVVDQ